MRGVRRLSFVVCRNGFAALAAALLFASACATTPEPSKEQAQANPTPTPEQKPEPTKTAAQQPADTEPWRAQPPQPGKYPDLVIPEFKRATLKNGLTLIVSERRDLPLISIGMALSAGSAQDPKGKAGLADLTHKLLLEGAGKRDAIALEDAFGDIGSQPYAFTTSDGSMVGTRVLTRNAAQGMELLADIVLRPRMAQDGFDLRKKQQLDSLAKMAGDPGYLAQWAFTSTLYGADHPYGKLTPGTPESVASLTLKDAKDFWAKNSGPKAAALVMAGDVTLEQARAWAEKYFGGWKGNATRPPVPPELTPDAVRKLVLVPKPGLNQTVVIVGRPAIEAGHADEPALELATTVFGGFFGSRLNMNLREAKGYSYGAYAYVDARRGEGPLAASSKVRADVTGPAVQVFIDELSGLKSRPITETELRAAREGLIQSMPGSFNTVDDLARSAAGIYWEDKELDHFKKLVERLQNATPQQVQAAAEKYLEPTSLDLVLVGDPDVVRTQVTPLNLGTLEVRDPPKFPVPTPPGAGAKRAE